MITTFCFLELVIFFYTQLIYNITILILKSEYFVFSAELKFLHIIVIVNIIKIFLLTLSTSCLYDKQKKSFCLNT